MVAPKALLIIPTFEHFDYAKRCAESFIKTTSYLPNDIAVIDDGSESWHGNHWHEWPKRTRYPIHFNHRDGLTRSWNFGLKLARDFGYKYAICGNSDLIFTKESYNGMWIAITSGYDLVGPITNASGHAIHQDIKNYGLSIKDDSEESLDSISGACQMIEDKYKEVPFINGFCMMAKTDTWWKYAFNHEHVFDPRIKLAGNEDDFQRRAKEQGIKIGISPRSFVFHYRSISRPEALSQQASKGYYRKPTEIK